jgi:hypothetical protein
LNWSIVKIFVVEDLCTYISSCYSIQPLRKEHTVAYMNYKAALFFGKVRIICAIGSFFTNVHRLEGPRCQNLAISEQLVIIQSDIRLTENL